MKCGCGFTVMDKYINDEFHCTLNVHDGPHIDQDKGYTWGVIAGEDGWTHDLRMRILERNLRAVRSGRWFNLKKRNP